MDDLYDLFGLADQSPRDAPSPAKNQIKEAQPKPTEPGATTSQKQKSSQPTTTIPTEHNKRANSLLFSGPYAKDSAPVSQNEELKAEENKDIDELFDDIYSNRYSENRSFPMINNTK